MNSNLFIGIDPGLHKSGIAFFDTKTELFILTELPLKNLLDALQANQGARIVLECPLLDSLVFPNRLQGKGLAKQLKIAQHIGANKAIASVIVDEMTSAGRSFAVVAPSDRVKVNAGPVMKMMKTSSMKDKGNLKRYLASLRYPTKMNRDQFELMTGFKGKSSEHSRDAATLIHNMNDIKFKQLKQRTMHLIDTGQLKI